MESRRPRSQRSSDPLDRRLDRWLDTGRQLVDGVSGARPGGRRSVDRVDGASRLDAVGRWVGDRIDWLLDEEEDWREPPEVQQNDHLQSWQSSRPARVTTQPAVDRATPTGRKRPLDALSRRQPVLPPPAAASVPEPTVPLSDEVWPEDDSFRVERWKRTSSDKVPAEPAAPSTARPVARRPLPRSSRRRD